jgi:cell division protein FtsI/penicillin-binding protein 2
MFHSTRKRRGWPWAFGRERGAPGQGDRRARPTRTRTWRQVTRQRLRVAGLVFALWALGIEARLFFLQVMSHEEFTARADGQQSRSIDAHPKRGEILDRNGRILAYSVGGDSIYAVPHDVTDATETTNKLCEVLECDDRQHAVIERRLAGSGPFAFVSRQVSPHVAQRVSDLDLTGIGFVPENRRYYPNGTLAAHVLGYVGIDNQGLAGIESSYDSEIGGRPGRIIVQTDARRRAFSRLERLPTTGASLELTIDTYLQYVTERELERGVRERRAVAGTAVVMDPYSGDVLAMASWPTFNPNAFADSEASSRRNRAIQDVYEPGSTFKIVTAAAALDEGLVSRTELFDVSAGRMRFGRSTVSDMYVYSQPLSFDEVIMKSSNVGAIQIGLRVGGERLSRYTRRFGFGQALARDLPGQSRGIVHPPSVLEKAREVASVSMGYAVSVTPVQMAAAFSAVANGGELVEPRLVRAVIRNGERIERSPRVVRRSISKETAAELTDIMVGVVENGTAKRARIPGFRVAGKTGTTEKIVGGRYSDTDHVASFAGFVPADRPEITILVMVDTPSGRPFTGGSVAAPIFQRIAESALRYRAVASAVHPEPAIFHVATPPRVVSRVSTSATVPAAAVQVEAREGRMPDLRGLSAREAVAALSPFRLVPRLDGDGFVTDQAPVPDAEVAPGESVTLVLTRVRRPDRDWPTIGEGQ